jgi:hypothetical protein
MTLLEWMRMKDHTFRSLHELCGIDHTLLCKYAKGTRKPKLQNMLIIEKITGGHVTVKDFFPEFTLLKDTEEDIDI